MRKIILCMMIMLAANFSCQELNLLIPVEQNSEMLINITPPSPESYFRTQYGNLQFNEFKGSPNVEIPIHTISSNHLKHSISLKYAKAGVKVNDIPNIAGMNWILEAGGIINRIIYDKADEVAGKRLLLSLDDLTLLYTSQGEPELFEYVKQMGLYDHQPDIFNFSFPGYSGSFYLDANFQPVLLTKNNDLKIETVGNFKNTYCFNITTNDGTKFTFGGTGATEKTWVRANAFESGITSFYLTKIEDTIGNKINFEYLTLKSNVTLLGTFESTSIQNKLFDQGIPAANTTAHPPVTPYTQSIKKINIQDPKILIKIITENEEINVHYDNVASNVFQKIVDIDISSHNNDIRKLRFDYVNNLTSDPQKKRFFLEKVKEYSINNNQENFIKEYKFSYEDPLGLPDRMTNSTDYLGYYNGTNNSNTSIPNLNLFNESYHIYNQNTSYYADRRPNFNFAKKGILKSIVYPTKGQTIFEYEPIFARDPEPIQGEKNQAIGNTEPVFSSNSDIDYDLVTSLIPLSYESNVNLQSSEVMGNKINIELKLHSNIANTIGDKAKAQFEIIDQISNQILFTQKIFINKTEQYSQILEDFIIEPGKIYQFKYRIIDNACKQCSATAVIKYPKISNWNTVDNGNIRLKRQYDISENGINHVKRIYYSDYKNINNISNLDLLYIPKFKSYRFDQKVYAPYTDPNSAPSVGNVMVGSILETIVQSELTDPMVYVLKENNDGNYDEYSYNVNDPIYPNISISYGGDQFENGGEEKKFTTQNIFNSYPFKVSAGDGMYTNSLSDISAIVGSAQNNLFWYVPLNNLSGKIISHRIFENKGGNLYLKSCRINEYNEHLLSVISSLNGITLYPLVFTTSGSNSGTYVGNMYIGAYKLPTYSNFLQKSISKEYLEDVPVTTTDDSNYKKIVTTTSYKYDNPEKQLSEKNTFLPDQTIQQTTYAYAHEKNNQLLIGKNMIGIPLETKTVQKQSAADPGKTVAKTEVVYPASLPTAQAGSLVVPLSSKSMDKLTGILSTDVSYDKYDEKGNILQYTGKDGLVTSIVWGYNKTQPVAKIEGMTYENLLSLASPAAIISASDEDAADPSKEVQLLEALNTFRKNSRLADKKVTTYTYDPLIGVTSITPPSGIRQSFSYDAANRLKETKVRGKNPAGAYTDKKAAEYRYNYKP